jgi:membrane-associated protein
MEIIKSFVSFFLHLDDHIGGILSSYGNWTYGLMFLIIFCETGLVITPFLPGDSLLFVLGAFSARGDLNFMTLWLLLTIAAVAGDALNYFIGKQFAHKIINNEKIPFLKKAHLDRTQAFFEKYGKKTIILARFVPLVRTFAPFLAGAGNMSYTVFGLFNVIGAVLWVTLGLGAGFLFGNISFVEKNFSLVVLGIVIVSLLPAAWEFYQHKKSSK